jgi:hypothetical protein
MEEPIANIAYFRQQVCTEPHTIRALIPISNSMLAFAHTLN